MLRSVYIFAVLFFAIGVQAALAGPVPPSTTPDLDVTTLGYVASIATGGYVALKRFVLNRNR
jgi:hypothetical protein